MASQELTDQMTTPSVNLNVFRYFSQYWAATLYRAESRYNLTSRRIPDNHWRVLYTRVLGNLKTAKEVVDAEAKPENETKTDETSTAPSEKTTEKAAPGSAPIPAKWQPVVARLRQATAVPTAALNRIR